jgi:hypothetical protein
MAAWLALRRRFAPTGVAAMTMEVGTHEMWRRAREILRNL